MYDFIVFHSFGSQRYLQMISACVRFCARIALRCVSGSDICRQPSHNRSTVNQRQPVGNMDQDDVSRIMLLLDIHGLSCSTRRPIVSLRLFFGFQPHCFCLAFKYFSTIMSTHYFSFSTLETCASAQTATPLCLFFYQYLNKNVLFLLTLFRFQTNPFTPY